MRKGLMRWLIRLLLAPHRLRLEPREETEKSVDCFPCLLACLPGVRSRINYYLSQDHYEDMLGINAHE